MEGLLAAPLNQYKELWSPTKPPQPVGHTPRRPMSAGRTTQHKSEGVQEDDKTLMVLSTGTSPEHTRAWLTQNLGLPTEEVPTVGVKLHATYTETTCIMHKPCEISMQTT
ncbi:hypothetical protein Taro_002089 [Colocasia esculenta]|uniref:Uncharacterized protein n=1 Tax=Colocasia esculenta TaxID=4460 RepID=A0A843TG85_COLES|nr:hypothetical protein [Colocasia esculenta]